MSRPMNCGSTEVGPGQVSKRGSAAFAPMSRYRAAFTEAKRRPWSPQDPGGNIVTVVAENKLSVDLVHERLSRCSPPPVDVLCYPNSYSGHERLRAALASTMERTFMHGVSVDPNNICIQAGAGAILDNLFWAIGDAGQGVLIPAPCYPQFDKDLTMKPVAVSLSSWMKRHQRPRLEAVLSVAQEVPGFQSLNVLAREVVSELEGGEARLARLLHVVYGLSKDFCASGLRVGCLHSRNDEIRQAVEGLSYYTSVSGHTQHLLSEILEDKEWVDSFLAENARRMKESYNILAATASMFCWLDLREALGSIDASCDPTWDHEEQLWEELAKRGVYLTPGRYCHAVEPGFFRMCWTWVEPKALPEAASRMRTAIDAFKKNRK
eukprot:gene25313-10969_t